jgi:hypothetical protein
MQNSDGFAVEFQCSSVDCFFHSMAIHSANQEYVSVRLVLRKSLKRRSRNGKARSAAKKSSIVARSLITLTNLEQSARIVHVSNIPKATSTSQEIKKNKRKAKEKLVQFSDSDQTRTLDTRNRRDDILVNRQAENKHSERTLRIRDTKTQGHSTKLGSHHDPESIGLEPFYHRQDTGNSIARKASTSQADPSTSLATFLLQSNGKVNSFCIQCRSR